MSASSSLCCRASISPIPASPPQPRRSSLFNFLTFEVGYIVASGVLASLCSKTISPASFKTQYALSPASVALFREIHAVHKILKAWIRPQTIYSEVSLKKVRKVAGSFLIRLVEIFEGFILFSQSCVDRCNHIRRGVAGFRYATDRELQKFPG